MNPVARLQQYADVDVALTRPSRFAAGDIEHRSRARRRARRDLHATLHGIRRAIWNEDTAPAIVGCAIAIVVAFLIVYLVG